MQPINQRQLGNTDLRLSTLTLGTVKFGRNQSVKYPEGFDLPDDHHLSELLALAREHGVNTLDTAPAYGISERRLGKLLDGQRHSWHIISKAGEFFDPMSGQSHYDFSPKGLRLSLENTLRTLRTDYLDIWLIHSDGNDMENLRDEILDVFLSARQEGLARAVGFSGKTVEGGRYALDHLDCIMMAASLSNDNEMSLFTSAQQRGKGLLLKKIWDSGWALHPGGNPAASKPEVMQQTFAKLFAQPAVCSAVIGTINPQHLLENLAAASLPGKGGKGE